MANELDLFNSHRNPRCTGCKINELPDNALPVFALMDFADANQADVLFISDSIKYDEGGFVAFFKEEKEYLANILKANFEGLTVEYMGGLKCPNLKEKDVTVNDINTCRPYIGETIDKIKPKLIFTCGNLAMRLVLRKSGMLDKRGKEFQYVSPTGFSATVIPIFHPEAFIAYRNNGVHHDDNIRKREFLFSLDIVNGIRKYVKGEKIDPNLKYHLIASEEDITNETAYSSFLDGVIDGKPIAIDIETEGLNVLQDKILSVGFSCNNFGICLPFEHSKSAVPVETARKFISNLLETQNPKILHNCKFDIKFLKKNGFTINGKIYDTKVLQHLINENQPKRLKDLVKRYFPLELEKF